MNGAFLSEMLEQIAERGRVLIGATRTGDRIAVDALVECCEELLSLRGEVSGVALARDILASYEALPQEQRAAFFRSLMTQFDVAVEPLRSAVANWSGAPSAKTSAILYSVAEPRRQELFRRLNLAPGATGSLVTMRSHLLDAIRADPSLAPLDADFQHLLSSWFNRGFLVLRRITWSTPANILDKIIHYEAVHEIGSWTDLRARLDPPDRRCYAFFHPALADEPLIFVQVALTREVPGAIAPILAAARGPVDVERATTAVFYSITNCQRGLAGVSFGSFLIKQVVAALARELPQIREFVTLSPVPGFAGWLGRELAADGSSASGSSVLGESDRAVLAGLGRPDWHADQATAESLRPPLLRAAATYFLKARSTVGAALDPVARFHLGNGARLDRINWLADTTRKGLRQSHGLMVNYRYDLDAIEKNHEAYAERGEIVASRAVHRLAARELELPVVGKLKR
ncbi:MCD, Malonyl-CoA decarboxylase MCD [Rhodoplanes elegans]|uniref:MCD, Malonyl-CoA decarboxylase MCD n=1 Tax=Rhodoplanes elegans TaxID=29408 RepID=A0A327KRH1_9BRAD|nr:malonyl-CoA decarboxylase [Rhodoplanes elegans]MBK5959623.1 MCD, Malonyl-CoA decarboxylase MCD [Rhodoplanes elegans]RAI41011.1 MCD, Malonyl-CoA decarboxylase MCD [Rhodoplanes elegans]